MLRLYLLDHHNTEEDTYYAKVLHIFLYSVYPQLGTELVNRNEVFDKLLNSELEATNSKNLKC